MLVILFNFFFAVQYPANLRLYRIQLCRCLPAAEKQRCWVHKTANVLDKLPKSIQSSAKSLIHDIYRAETERDARSAYQRFQDRYQAKYAIAVENLKKDEASLFTFYHYQQNTGSILEVPMS